MGIPVNQPAPGNLQGQLREFCGDLLGRAPHDPFSTQIARVVERLWRGDTTWIADPEHVIVAMRLRRVVPEWRAGDPETALRAAFAAAVYPRRLGDQEFEARLNQLAPVYGSGGVAGGLDGAGDVIAQLRELGRLHDDRSDAEIMILLADLAAVEDPEAIAGAALYLATLTEQSIYGYIDEKGERCGLLRNWDDDAEFVRFFRSDALYDPPSNHFPKLCDTYGAPVFENVWPAFERSLREDERRFAKKAVDMEAVLWKLRPTAAPPDWYRQELIEFWDKQHQRLNSGFPYFCFESHFPRWWKQCGLNFRNEVMRKISVQAPIDPADASKPVARLPRRQRTVEPPPPPVLTPLLLHLMRESWRLARSTFYVREPLTDQPWVEHENLRKLLDEFWGYYLRKDILREPHETIREILDHEGEDMKQATANTLVARIKGRTRAHNVARVLKLDNAGVLENIKANNLTWEPQHSTIASVARMAAPDETLLWAFLAHVCLRTLVQRQRPDKWDIDHCVSEVVHWLDDPLFPSCVCRATDAGKEPDASVLAALSELLGGRSVTCAEVVIEGLCTLMERLGQANGDFWSRWFLDRVVKPCGQSVYRHLGEVLNLEHREMWDWISPLWILFFLQGHPNSGDKAGLEETYEKTVPADDRECFAIKHIAGKFRGHCAQGGAPHPANQPFGKEVNL